MKTAHHHFYIHKLKEVFSLKQRQNPQYSLRAFARDMGLHSSTLCQIFKGRRSLPLKVAPLVTKKLGLGPKDRTLFMESLNQIKTKIDKIKIPDHDARYMLDESYFRAIAEWEHYAIYTLFDLDHFIPSMENFSAHLGITIQRTEVVVNTLLKSGLLFYDQTGSLRKSFLNLRTTEDINSQALVLAHLEALEMGKKKLEAVDVSLRDFSSITFAMDLEKLPEIKTIIREFRQKVAALAKDGNKTEVFQMAIQFYPMTSISEINKNKRGKKK